MNDTRAREYTIWNTPLSVLLRGKIGPGTFKVEQRIDPLATVRQSDLPEPAKVMIAQVLKKTRLWEYEKQEIAEELLAHFADGITAGGRVEDLIASFGDVRKAAKLMRRAKKRNRPLWWKLMRGSARAFAWFLLFYIGLALLLSLRHPNPRTDYVALLNTSTANAPESDRAWPIYRDAWTKARMWKFDDASLRVSDDRTARWSRPGDDRWPDAVAFLRDHQQLLDSLREAGQKPSLGWEFRTGGMETWPAEDRAAFTDQPASKKPANTLFSDELMAHSTIAILLPYLSEMRASATLLAADIRWAASEGDAKRVLADYRALVGMARQCGEAPILVNQLVELGILAVADETLMAINQSSPQSLEKCRVELLHVMASSTPMLKMNLAGERMCFMDMVQRVYSDDGEGDGAPTLDGMRVMGNLSRITPNPNQPGLTAVHSLALPAAVAVMASRKELTQRAEFFYATSQEDAERPLWVKLHARGKTDALLQEWQTSRSGFRYAMLAMMAGSFERSSLTFDQRGAVHEAAMVALTLEAWRAKAGTYPDDLGELVPHYLPAVPLDRSTGAPLRYKLVDGKPLLYGLGKDGVDDGGVWVEDKATRWANVPAKGDWVLYPEPEPAEPAKQ